MTEVGIAAEQRVQFDRYLLDREDERVVGPQGPVHLGHKAYQVLEALIECEGKVIPATFTAKYHFDLEGVKPYLGAEATYFWWVDVKPGADTIPRGVTRTTLSDELGFVLQAGADVAVDESGFAFTVDAKRYFVDTTARWYAGDTLAIETEHKLDPWVVSAGLGYRF